MKALLPILLTTTLTTHALAQAVDVGLTMDGGVLTVIYGQDCGPVGCQPFLAGPIGAGQTRVLTQYSMPTTLYAIAIGDVGPCVQVPGFQNVLLLANPFVIGWGLTSTPPFVPLPCDQGLANETLTIPANAPPGIVFRVQSFGVSANGSFAFGPAIESVTI